MAGLRNSVDSILTHVYPKGPNTLYRHTSDQLDWVESSNSLALGCVAQALPGIGMRTHKY